MTGQYGESVISTVFDAGGNISIRFDKCGHVVTATANSVLNTAITAWTTPFNTVPAAFRPIVSAYIPNCAGLTIGNSIVIGADGVIASSTNLDAGAGVLFSASYLVA